MGGHRGRRRAVALVVALTALVATGAAANAAPTSGPTVWFFTGDATFGQVGPGDQAARLDPNPLHCEKGEDDCNLQGIAFAAGRLWVADATNGLRAIDPSTGRAVNRPNDGRYSSNPVPFDGRLWFTTVTRVESVHPPDTAASPPSVSLPGAFTEDVAASRHVLWVAGSGDGRTVGAAVGWYDPRTGTRRTARLPATGEVAPLVAPMDDTTAYVVTSPTGPDDTAPPSELFRVAIPASGSPQVSDLGPLSFGPGGIVAVDGHLWLNDVNASRLVELDPRGVPTGQVALGVGGDGQLVGAAGQLWYVGSARRGHDSLVVVDPRTGSITRTVPITLPGSEEVYLFTVIPGGH